ALNWPAKAGGKRGEAAVKFTDPADRVVWETWKADYELFQPDPLMNIPTPWDSFDALTPCPGTPRANSGKERILASFSKFTDFNQATFTGFGGPLVGRNQTYVRFEVRVNEQEFKFIHSNQLYLRDKLALATANGPLTFTNNAIEVKAAWMEVKPADEAQAKKRYYATSAQVLDPVMNVCAPRLMALVGFHIVQKTTSSPEWIWASFEHIDNVPANPPAAGPLQFAFNDPMQPQALKPPQMPP